MTSQQQGPVKWGRKRHGHFLVVSPGLQVDCRPTTMAITFSACTWQTCCRFSKCIDGERRYKSAMRAPFPSYYVTDIWSVRYVRSNLGNDDYGSSAASAVSWQCLPCWMSAVLSAFHHRYDLSNNQACVIWTTRWRLSRWLRFTAVDSPAWHLRRLNPIQHRCYNFYIHLRSLTDNWPRWGRWQVSMTGASIVCRQNGPGTIFYTSICLEGSSSKIDVIEKFKHNLPSRRLKARVKTDSDAKLMYLQMFAFLTCNLNIPIWCCTRTAALWVLLPIFLAGVFSFTPTV